MNTVGVVASIIIFAVSCVACERVLHAATSVPTHQQITPTKVQGLIPVDPNQLKITDGLITKYSTTEFAVRQSIRGEFGWETRHEAEIGFIYRGPSAKSEPLASGEIRRQIGLKLLAKNTCNVFYIMWHIEPNKGIFVAVKSNPGESRHEECRDNGYISVKSTAQSPLLVHPIRIGENHTLRAVLDGKMIRVFTDGIQTWTGELPAEAATLNGPVGIRTDGGDFDVEMRVSQ